MGSIILTYFSTVFHWCFPIDFFLNLITPLKLFCPPGTIVGISRWRLRWSYRGIILISRGNQIVFENPEPGKLFFSRKSLVRLRGKDNKIIVRGQLWTLPAHVNIKGYGNRMILGARFDNRDPKLEWDMFGKENLLEIGDDARVTCGTPFTTYQNKMEFFGERCSMRIGRESKFMIVLEANRGISYDFHCAIGDHVAISAAAIGMSSMCTMSIGDGFFCSWDCYFWIGAHALLDSEGNVLNDCRKISIGKNVWFGHGVEVPGQINVAEGCVIGSNVTLCKDVRIPNSVVTVAPAKIYPVDVRWVRESPIMIQRGIKWYK